MIPSLISLTFILYTPYVVYYKIYPWLGGNIEKLNLSLDNIW